MGSLSLQSPVGRLVLADRAGALVRLAWGPARAHDPTPLLSEASAQLKAYFAGRLRCFDLPLAPTGTRFQHRVWAAMARIPYGETATYGELARTVDTAARAIGGACGANPIPIILPCHRVLATGGGLGGYSGAGGTETKVGLLALEARCRRHPGRHRVVTAAAARDRLAERHTPQERPREVVMPDVTIAAADGGSFSAYLANPATGTGGGILVIQEIFGVNQVMRGIADGLAAQGYFALCPDIFWRQEPGIQLTDRTDEDWARAFALFNGFDEAKGIEDLKASLAYLRALPGCNTKVGTVGYCLGGRLAYLMAARSDAACNVSYYGVGIENNLVEAANVTAPTLLHIAALDKFVPAEAQDKVRAAFSAHPHVAVHTYANADHAFARTGGKEYDQAAAELANARSADCFAAHLV